MEKKKFIDFWKNYGVKNVSDKLEGGLNMLDFNCMQKASKLMWIKRFYLKEKHFWKIICQ